MIDIKDLKLGDTISIILNGRYVAGEVTYLDIEEKPGSPMSDERPGKIKIKFLELFWEREYPDRGCEIYQAWIDENPDKYKMIDEVLLDENVHIIAKEGNTELMDDINQALKAFLESDEYESLKAKYGI